MKTTVRSLLEGKGRAVHSLEPDQYVYEALSLMADENLGAVLVMEENRLVGIMSERDYARKVILAQRASKDTPLRDIMTTRVETVTEDDSVDQCMELMTEGRFRHLPVMDGDEVVGVISIGDVVKAVIENQRRLIGDLERYITG